MENNSDNLKIMNDHFDNLILTKLLPILVIIILPLLAYYIYISPADSNNDYEQYLHYTKAKIVKQSLDNALYAREYNTLFQLLQKGDYKNVKNGIDDTQYKGYRDFEILQTYSKYKERESNMNSIDYYKAYKDNHLNFGKNPFSKDVQAFYNSMYPAYKETNEYVSELSKKAPYIGLNEAFIDYTLLGKHDDSYSADSDGKHCYSWDKTNENRKYTATVKNNKVIDFTYNSLRNVYTPPSTSSNTTRKYQDPYDVNDYDDEEDFYYDHEDEFEDQEDAEDYYWEHHED